MLTLLAVVVRLIDWLETAPLASASFAGTGGGRETRAPSTTSRFEILVFAIGLLLATNLSVAHSTKNQAPASAAPVSAAAPTQRILRETLRVDLVNGQDQLLSTGSVWQLAGAIDQGELYRPTDAHPARQADRDTAWLVFKEAQLVGQYRPAEQRFVALTAPQALANEVAR